MAFSADPSSPVRPPRSRRQRSGWSLRLTPAGVGILMLLNLVIIGLIFLGLIWMRWIPLGQAPVRPSPTATETTPIQSGTHTPTPTPSRTVSPSPILSPQPTLPASTPTPLATLLPTQGIILLAIDEGATTNLFAYQPHWGGSAVSLPLTRLTNGPWDDVAPALSPDGQRLAFASNRNGYWDIYLMDLTSGLVTPLTDTPGYDSAPAWSPDGLWIVYETYLDENLEIMISSAVGTGETIRLTNHPAADHSPAWSPQGRQIAFISQRDGTNQIWLADLDQPESMRYQIVNHDIGNYSAHPAWSPAGESLAWVGEQDGLRQVFLWTPAQPEMSPRIIGSGDWPTWSPDGQRLLTLLRAPNHSYLTAYPVFTTGLALPPLLLPGEVDGIEWVDLPNSIPLRDPFRQAALLTLTPAWQPNLTVQPDQSGGRYSLVPLQDVEAPFAQLHDAVDEAFQALRDRVAYEVGWDYLATLENAYTPLTTSLEPGMQQDWLYTGRSFTLNTLPINAGWVVVVREDFGQQTYWRLFLRARFQDGSAGAPLRELPWDFNARYDGDPTVYDAGGRFVDQIPPGYWIDLTRLAGSYGWERLPALFTWRSAYSAARFNQFVRSEGLDWATAMLQLYPAEILITPSPIIPPTRTFTPTPRFYQTPTPTVTPTLRPTFTPLPPTATVTPNFTPTKVQPTTPLPTRTSTPSKIPSLTPTPKE